MKGWNICDGSLMIAQYEMEKRQEYQSFLPQEVCNFSKPRTQSNLKPKEKRIQKTSLKGVRNFQKPKQNCDSNSQTTKTSPPVHPPKGTTQNSHLVSIRSQEKPIPQRLICTNIKVQKINLQASEAYCFSPPSPVLPPKYANLCNVKINYINSINQVNRNKVEMKVQTFHSPPVRTLRRMNTEPTRFVLQNCEEFEKKEDNQKLPFDLSKSMDYQEEVKIKSLKSTQNLNELKCINAESVADESELQDEISIVVSPLSDEIQFNRPIFTPDLWNEQAYYDMNCHDLSISEVGKERLMSL